MVIYNSKQRIRLFHSDVDAILANNTFSPTAIRAGTEPACLTPPLLRPKHEVDRNAMHTPPAERRTSVDLVNRLEWRSTESLLIMVLWSVPNQQSSLSPPRLVSRRLYSIAMRLNYNHIYQLSDKLIDLSDHAQLDSFERELLSNYRCDTRHVRIQRRLKTRPVNWSKVLRFLLPMKQFQFRGYPSIRPPWDSAETSIL